MKGLLASHPVALTVVVAAAALYLGLRADRGWIPHDEGLLAGSAERVLAGELPHRDFTDVYTGALAYLHALAFHLFGVHLLALRLLLLFFALVFTVAFYRIAARFAPPPLAALASAAALAWSLPNYFAGLPSWYNLFFSVFGALALLKYLEDARSRWLLAAGLAGGFSFLIKSNGLFFVAAALLVLVYREQATAAEETLPGRDRLFSVFVAASLAVFVAGLAATVAKRMTAGDLLYFVFPGFALSLFLVAEEIRLERRRRWRRLLVPIAVLLAGAALPVALFLVPYVATGSLGDFWNGVVVLPQKRFDFANFAPPRLVALAAVLPVAALFALGFRSCSRRIENVLLVPVIVLLAVGAALGSRSGVYTAVWLSVRPLVPLATVVGCVLLARAAEISPGRRQRLFLILAMAATFSLVQFPYAHGIYFCYAAPWVVLVLLAVALAQPRAPRRLFLGVMVFYALFAVLWLNRGYVRHLGFAYTRVEQATDMGLERGGLKISLPMALFYRQLVAHVQAHSGDGAYVYAAPDCPEVYFLAGRRNPTRTFYDFLDDDFGFDPPGRRRRILRLLEERGVEVVVLNWEPEFSLGVQRDLGAALQERYPQSVRLPPFTVHWREPEGRGGEP